MKKFFIGIRYEQGQKVYEVIWNWPRNINSDIYPEYDSFMGPFDTREQALAQIPR